MIVGIHYVVTRGSANSEFQVGDHVWLDDDGSLMCQEGSGWILPEDVPSATKEMIVEIDEAWTEKRKARLERQLAELHA